MVDTYDREDGRSAVAARAATYDIEPDSEFSDSELTADERSLGELLSELSRETTTLIRHEVQLAKVEMSQKAAEAGKNVGFLVAGGAVAYAGFLVLMAALVMGLDEFMPTGLAALIVGALVAGVGAILVQKGQSALQNMNLAPEETIETLKEDKEWLQRQI